MIFILFPSFICSKIASKYFIKQNYGNIVNISSVAGGNYSIVAGVHYTASKAGVIGLTKQLAFELSKYNIRVNCVAPSQTKTETLMQNWSDIHLEAEGATGTDNNNSIDASLSGAVATISIGKAF